MFRIEAVSRHQSHLSGDVAIAMPIAWQSIGYLIFCGVAAGAIFLSLARYSRVETVTSTITPDVGVSAIIPTRAGVIAGLAVGARAALRPASTRPHSAEAHQWPECGVHGQRAMAKTHISVFIDICRFPAANARAAALVPDSTSASVMPGRIGPCPSFGVRSD